MIPLLAMLFVAQPVPGCRSMGSSVQCVLASPIAIAAKPIVTARQSEPAPPSPPSAPTAAHVATPARHADKPAPKPRDATPKPPSEAEVQRHIESLVSISDCTGARTYAAAIGQADLAEKTFQACITRPAPVLATAKP